MLILFTHTGFLFALEIDLRPECSFFNKIVVNRDSLFRKETRKMLSRADVVQCRCLFSAWIRHTVQALSLLPLDNRCIYLHVLRKCTGRSSYCQLLLLHHLIDKSCDIMTHGLKYTKACFHSNRFIFSQVGKRKQLERHLRRIGKRHPFTWVNGILFTTAVKISDA